MRARSQGRSTTGGPPPAAPVPRPASSAVAWATVPDGSSGSLAVGNAALATRAATAKEAVDAAVAKEAAKEVAKKKAAEEAAMRKLVAEETMGKKKAAEEAALKRKAANEAAAKKKASEEVAKKTKSGAVTTGSGPSLAPSIGVKMLRQVALHLRPSGDSTGLGSLGTVCDTSFSISCTASVILI
jgi:hypothetical protein